jgi:hypothetical protein
MSYKLRKVPYPTAVVFGDQSHERRRAAVSHERRRAMSGEELQRATGHNRLRNEQAELEDGQA